MASFSIKRHFESERKVFLEKVAILVFNVSIIYIGKDSRSF